MLAYIVESKQTNTRSACSLLWSTASEQCFCGHFLYSSEADCTGVSTQTAFSNLKAVQSDLRHTSSVRHRRHTQLIFIVHCTTLGTLNVNTNAAARQNSQLDAIWDTVSYPRALQRGSSHVALTRSTAPNMKKSISTKTFSSFPSIERALCPFALIQIWFSPPYSSKNRSHLKKKKKPHSDDRAEKAQAVILK